MADDALNAVLAHLMVRKLRGDRAECVCPAHDDRVASLSVAKGTDQPVVLHCHAGCTPDAVVKAIGLTLADLTGQGTPHCVAQYPYVGVNGDVLYWVERWVPKTFRPRLVDGTYARPSASTEVLYNLAVVRTAIANGDTVYLVEGEKDVEVMREFGFVATTAMSGASQPWLPQFSEQLAGAHLVIIADNDKAGRTRTRRLVEELEPIARSCRAGVARYGKDIADHLLAGYSIDLLDPLPSKDTSLVVYHLQNVLSQPLTFAWQGWIPDAMLTLIEGDPGEGKSVLTVDLAARWTTGMPMPDGTPNPFGGPIPVGMVSAEDDPGKVIRPRFIAAGGNPQNLVYVAGVPMGGRYLRSLDLELDVDAIREAIEEYGLRVLILDPLMAFLGSTRTAVDNEVRKVLTPLRYLSEEMHCAIICVRHLRKAGGKAVHAGGGSIAFTGAARSVLLVGRNPNDDEQRILAITKSNVAKSPTSLAYRLDSDPLRGVPVVRWEGESELRAADLLDTLTSNAEVRGEVAEEVTRLLSIEQLPYEQIRRRVLANGVECGEKMLRSVLKSVAEQVRTGHGTQAYKVVYRLKSEGGPNVEPSSEWQDDTEVPSTSAPEWMAPGDIPASAIHSDDQVDGSVDSPAKDQAVPVSDDSSDPQVDGTSEGTAIHSDLAIVCSVCGATSDLLYWEDVSAWRCRHHNPLTYGGKAEAS